MDVESKDEDTGVAPEPIDEFCAVGTGEALYGCGGDIVCTPPGEVTNNEPFIEEVEECTAM